ncbi:hypothetical protein [Mucilaginibacter sp.]|jgi:hypothetical protein|nr:hypothetical protein [Mucilaginibacter sp.]
MGAKQVSILQAFQLPYDQYHQATVILLPFAAFGHTNTSSTNKHA